MEKPLWKGPILNLVIDYVKIIWPHICVTKMLPSNLSDGCHCLSGTFHADSNWRLCMHCLQMGKNVARAQCKYEKKKKKYTFYFLGGEPTCVWVAMPLIWARLPCKLAICCLSLTSWRARVLVAACRTCRQKDRQIISLKGRKDTWTIDKIQCHKLK